MSSSDAADRLEFLEREAWAEQDEKDRQADDARLERWVDIQNSLREYAAVDGWPMAIRALAQAMQTQQDFEARR